MCAGDCDVKVNSQISRNTFVTSLCANLIDLTTRTRHNHTTHDQIKGRSTARHVMCAGDCDVKVNSQISRNQVYEFLVNYTQAVQ